MHRSGSTLQYQIASAICEGRLSLDRLEPHWKNGVPTGSALHAKTSIIKVHRPARALERKLDPEAVRYLYSYRDLRDVVASLIERGSKLRAVAARQVVQKELSAYRAFTARRHTLVTRYEEFVQDVPSLISKIEHFLGVHLTDEERSSIAEDLELDRQRKRVESLMKKSDSKILNRETLLTRDHIGDARVGKWQEILTPALARAVTEEGRDWLEEHGYL